MFETIDLNVHKNLCAILDVASGTERCEYDRRKSIRAAGYLAQALHELLKRAFLLVMVAVADTHPPGMPPDSGGHEQETQVCRRQRGVPHGLKRGALLTVEQL